MRAPLCSKRPEQADRATGQPLASDEQFVHGGSRSPLVSLGSDGGTRDGSHPAVLSLPAWQVALADKAPASKLLPGKLTAMDKPVALTDMTDILPEAFQALKAAFHIDDVFSIDLSDVTAASVEQLGAECDVAAFTMRKIQLLNAIAPVGVPTATDIVVGLCLELVRAISQLLNGDLEAKIDSSQRSILMRALRDLHSCGVVVGTMLPSGEIAFLR